MKGCSLVSPILTLTRSITHLEHHVAPECVAVVDASCDRMYMCVITLFASDSKSVYAYVWIVCINIPSVNLSLLMFTMCQCTECVFYQCMQCVWLVYA